jgi:hypothetical protein
MSKVRIILSLLTATSALLITACNHQQKKVTEFENEDELFSERDRMDLAMQQEFMMTVDPALGYVPIERLDKARRLMNAKIAAKGSGTKALTWQERGPNNVAGRTRALLIDANDATGNTVFAASVSGGIWKGTNFKTTPVWTPVADEMSNLAVCALAQDPSNPSILYAGTGEGWFNIDAVRGNGIWKSTDGGSTWAHLASTDSTANNASHNFDYVGDIVVNNNGVVFESSRPSKYCNTGGVLRSADGGTTWTRSIGVLRPNATTCDSAFDYFAADLEIASNGDIYATTGFGNSGEINNLGRIWRSSAAQYGANVGAGGTWKDITPSGTWKRIELACAPGHPSTIYALLEGSTDGIGAIKKSIDTGKTWTNLTLPTWCNQGTNSSDFTNKQAWYDLIAAVDPTDSNKVLIGGIDVFRSTNGGTAWTQLTQWANRCTTLPTIHADQHNLVFYPGSSSQFIATNDGGIYYTSNSGTSFTNKNNGYITFQSYSCDIHPTQTDYFLLSGQDNGTQVFSTPGINNTVEASVGGDGAFCHIDQTNGNIQIAGYVYNNYFYTRDGTVPFSRVSFNNNGFFINPTDYDDVLHLLYSSSSPNQMGIVTGLNGTAIPAFSTATISSLSTRKISAIKVDPTVSAGGTAWIAGYDSTGALRPNLIKLSNIGSLTPTTVKTVTIAAGSVPAGSYISSIDIDPNNGNHLLITLSNYGITSVFESTDGGTTFNNIEGDLPDMPVRWGMFVPSNASVDGTNPGGILLATELGVWYTQQSNGTSTVWTPQNSGIPNIRTDMIKLRRSDNLLAAATHGRGLFTTNLTSVATGIPIVDNTKDFIKYVSSDRQQLLIKVGNLTTTKIQVRLFDATGKLVNSTDTRYIDQYINIGNLASGSYIIKIYGNKNEQYTRQFVK